MRHEDLNDESMRQSGSGGLPTIADEEGRAGAKSQHASRAGPDPKPTAVQSGSHLCDFGRKPIINRPAGQWPMNCGDAVHEDDGGFDMSGANLGSSTGVEEKVQDGRDMFRQMVAKLYQKDGFEFASDDVTSEDIDPQLVKKARQVELEFFRHVHVYDKVPRRQQRDSRGKIISTRWVDTHNGDLSAPDDCSRLVGQSFATHNDDSLYAAPLAATIGDGENAK